MAIVTGGANGIGAEVAHRLADRGAHLVIADVDLEGGRRVATDVGGIFVPTDVRDLDANVALVAAAVEHFGGVDLIHLNAGVTTGTYFGNDFDLERYRRAMAINLDGVVFGVQAALPALRSRTTGGQIIATASMAGLTATSMDPFYGANKHAVVGLVRSLGVDLEAEGIRVNALCPSFAATDIITEIRPFLDDLRFPILDVADVADTFMQIVDGDETGRCWFVVPGRVSEPFAFRNVPGPRPIQPHEPTEQGSDA